jgi:hypothetical protein
VLLLAALYIGVDRTCIMHRSKGSCLGNDCNDVSPGAAELRHYLVSTVKLSAALSPHSFFELPAAGS